MFSPLLKEVAINGLLLARLRSQPETKAGLGLYALTGLLVAVGLAFLIHAGHLALKIHHTDLDAALWMSFFLLITAFVAGMTAHILTSARQRKNHAHREEQLSETIHTIIEALGDELEGPVRENPKIALLIAGMSGLFAGTRLR